MTLQKAFYSPSELGAMVDLTSDTIMNYIHSGKLYAIQLSERTYRIPQREVARFLGRSVEESSHIEEPHGGTAQAEAIRRRVRGEERVPVAR